MSLYAEYLRERTNDGIIEAEDGFATFRFLHETKQVYIIDIFVESSHRKKGRAAQLADQIAEIAKAREYRQLVGTVVPSTKHATDSLRVLLAYGMTLHSAGNDLIIFTKDL